MTSSDSFDLNLVDTAPLAVVSVSTHVGGGAGGCSGGAGEDRGELTGRNYSVSVPQNAPSDERLLKD